MKRETERHRGASSSFLVPTASSTITKLLWIYIYTYIYNLHPHGTHKFVKVARSPNFHFSRIYEPLKGQSYLTLASFHSYPLSTFFSFSSTTAFFPFLVLHIKQNCAGLKKLFKRLSPPHRTNPNIFTFNGMNELSLRGRNEENPLLLLSNASSTLEIFSFQQNDSHNTHVQITNSHIRPSLLFRIH